MVIATSLRIGALRCPSLRAHPFDLVLALCSTVHLRCLRVKPFTRRLLMCGRLVCACTRAWLASCLTWAPTVSKSNRAWKLRARCPSTSRQRFATYCWECSSKTRSAASRWSKLLLTSGSAMAAAFRICSRPANNRLSSAPRVTDSHWSASWSADRNTKEKECFSVDSIFIAEEKILVPNDFSIRTERKLKKKKKLKNKLIFTICSCDRCSTVRVVPISYFLSLNDSLVLFV